MTLGRCELLGENFAYFPCTSAHGVPLSLLAAPLQFVRFGRWDAIHHEQQTNKAVLRLIHNRPGPVGCENAWTGPLRRSSAPARKKAIVGKW
jgi:hypothetical protein